MLYLKHSGKEQCTFKKSFSVPWIVACQYFAYNITFSLVVVEFNNDNFIFNKTNYF